MPHANPYKPKMNKTPDDSYIICSLNLSTCPLEIQAKNDIPPGELKSKSKSNSPLFARCRTSIGLQEQQQQVVMITLAAVLVLASAFSAPWLLHLPSSTSPRSDASQEHRLGPSGSRSEEQRKRLPA